MSLEAGFPRQQSTPLRREQGLIRKDKVVVVVVAGEEGQEQDEQMVGGRRRHGLVVASLPGTERERVWRRGGWGDDYLRLSCAYVPSAQR